MALVCALTLPAPGAAAARLRVLDAGVLTPVLRAGETAKVKVAVRNTARRAVRGGTIRFRVDGAKAPGSARVGRIRGRSTKTVTGRVTIPAGTRPGARGLSVCLGRQCAKRTEPLGVLAAPAAGSLGGLDVTPRPAEGASTAEGTISRDGGSLTAIAPDGRVYTLVVPSGALADDTAVTMTPLAAVDGSPFAGGLVGGVALQPAGLEFARPAALVISGEGVAPAPGQAAFAYDGAGRDFHVSGWFRRPPAFAAGWADPEKSVVIPVEHFSGYGVAPATDLESARELRYSAMEARNRLTQEVGRAIGEERNRQLRGEETGDLQDLTGPALGEFLEQVLLPEAAAASFSDAMFESAVRDFLSWERQRQILGQSDEVPERYAKLVERVNQLLAIAWEKLVERAEKRCYAGDFSIIARIVPLERQRELLGSSVLGTSGDPNEFSAALVRCMKFELRVVTRVEHRGAGGTPGFRGSVDETYELRAVVPLAMGSGDGIQAVTAELSGTAPLTYAVATQQSEGEVDFGFGASRCQTNSTGQTIAGQLTVQQGWLGLSPKGVNEVRRILDPFVSFDVGDPQEEINQRCQVRVGQENSTTDENQFERNWLRWWRAFHRTEHVNSDTAGGGDGEADPGPWRFTLRPQPWPLVGLYAADESDAVYGVRVIDTWELVHTPPRRPGKG